MLPKDEYNVFILCNLCIYWPKEQISYIWELLSERLAFEYPVSVGQAWLQGCLLSEVYVQYVEKECRINRIKQFLKMFLSHLLSFLPSIICMFRELVFYQNFRTFSLWFNIVNICPETDIFRKPQSLEDWFHVIHFATTLPLIYTTYKYLSHAHTLQTAFSSAGAACSLFPWALNCHSWVSTLGLSGRLKGLDQFVIP